MSSQFPSAVVLGSQSPRRRELLRHLLNRDAIRTVPPRNPVERDFDDARTLEAIDARLLEIAWLKHADVSDQLTSDSPAPCVVSADTVIVGLEDSGRPVVLGKPPVSEVDYRRTVRRWFERYYAGRRHLAKTGLCIGRPGRTPSRAVVTTSVWFRTDSMQFVDWYLDTGEPRGKAGGYAIQESGSLFVERIEGSLSNVVGLPLIETLRLLGQAGTASA